MIAFVARRVVSSLFVVGVVVSLVFVLMHAVGDPAVATLGEKAGPEQLAEFKARYGLNRPLHEQFLGYLGVIPCTRPASPEHAKGARCGLLQGDLGESFGYGEPVAEVVATRLPRTLLLGGMALGFEVAFGLLVGIFAAVRRNSWFDTSAMSLAFLGISLPTFVTGPVFLTYLAYRLGWFPLGGYGIDFFDHVGHAVLPAFTLAIVGTATYARIMRSEMIDALRADYVRTGFAKGLGPVAATLRHAARNALLPIVTLIGLSMATLVSGAIVTEVIFGWPGMGMLAIDAISNLDAPTVMAVVLVFSLAVQAGNLLADLAVAALDPRVRAR